MNKDASEHDSHTCAEKKDIKKTKGLITEWTSTVPVRARGQGKLYINIPMDAVRHMDLAPDERVTFTMKKIEVK
ncbi:MAG: hypothetical protein FWD92_03050 [Methanomassiliicoccaceae archaeon]|nr:hypothetical protein [Methanomassiliicoccaceae archaeon]